MSVECANSVAKNLCTAWLACGLFICTIILGIMPNVIADGAPLVAPMGASVMLMLLSATSAFARPRSVVLANFLATAIGLVVTHVFPSLLMASAAAVALTIGAMGAFRAIHPPSAGIALFAVSQGAHTASDGFALLFGGVMTRTAVILILVIGLNRLGDVIWKWQSKV